MNPTPPISSPHPRPFDQATYNKLDATDLRLLEHLNFLSRLQAKKSPTGARYCCPSERYLAANLSVSRETVSHHVSKLRRLGILDVTRRRQIRGIWRTNMYKIISWVWWRLRQATLRALNHPYHVKQSPHISIPREIINPKPQIEGAAPPLIPTLSEMVAAILKGKSLPRT